MREIMDGEEGRDGAEDGDIFAEMASSKYLPSFEQKEYPLLAEDDDGMNSPRIKDEVWGNYEAQSQDEAGASQMRQNPQF
mmetsp:Transcript_27838/g.37180  ORF Transcript_27838/g.37180 Transcript_27838/m.37180 type:complete len:80 (-) Transcript_27838:846-1085(-)